MKYGGQWMNGSTEKVTYSSVVAPPKNSLLKICRPAVPKPKYKIHNILQSKMMKHLRLGLILLYEHKFNHNFKNCI